MFLEGIKTILATLALTMKVAMNPSDMLPNIFSCTMAITDMFPIPKAHRIQRIRRIQKDVQVGPTEQREKMHKPLWAPTRWYFGNEALGKKSRRGVRQHPCQGQISFWLFKEKKGEFSFNFPGHARHDVLIFHLPFCNGVCPNFLIFFFENTVYMVHRSCC